MKVAESRLSRNTTTVPKPVRVALNLKSGDVLEWYIEGDKITIVKKGEAYG
jgi:AbrB family looped-hinge helix DNA binding protein